MPDLFRLKGESYEKEIYIFSKYSIPVQISEAAHRKERMELPQDRARDRWNIERSGFPENDGNGYRQRER